VNEGLRLQSFFYEVSSQAASFSNLKTFSHAHVSEPGSCCLIFGKEVALLNQQ
jgi:hypothetical protein